MRTTVTLDADTEAALRRLMAEQGLSFKEALNRSIRRGVDERARPDHRPTRVHRMGEPVVDVVHALRIAAADEDEELVRRMRTGQ